MWNKIKCFFGFHDLVVSSYEQELLTKCMAESYFARVLKIDELPDGTKIVFKVCTRCGAKR